MFCGIPACRRQKKSPPETAEIFFFIAAGNYLAMTRAISRTLFE
jgi:hypothetical protein